MLKDVRSQKGAVENYSIKDGNKSWYRKLLIFVESEL